MGTLLITKLVIATLVVPGLAKAGSGAEYQVGVGIADMTGPCADIGFVSCVHIKSSLSF